MTEMHVWATDAWAAAKRQALANSLGVKVENLFGVVKPDFGVISVTTEVFHVIEGECRRVEKPK